MFYKVQKLTKDFVDNYNAMGAEPSFESVVYINRQQIVSVSSIDKSDLSSINDNTVIEIKLSNGETIETLASQCEDLLSRVIK